MRYLITHFFKRFMPQKLRGTLVLAFATVSLIPLWVVGLTNLFIQIDTTHRNVLQYIDVIAQTQSAHIEDWLKQSWQMLDLILSDPFIRWEDLPDTAHNRQVSPAEAQVAAHLTLFHQHSNLFIELFVYNREGTVVISTDLAAYGTNISLEPFFAASFIQDYLQPPYVSNPDSKPTMLLTRPLRSQNGDVNHVLSARLNLDMIQEIMQETLNLGHTGESYLISDQTRRPLSNVSYQEPSGMFSSDGIRKAFAGTQGSSIYLNYETPPRVVVGNYRYISTLDAALLVEIPENEAYQPVMNSLLISIGGLTLALIATLTIGYMVATWLTKPLTQLTTAVHQFSQGDLTQRVHLRRKDEIGQLADSFNTMADQLGHSINTLEEIVIQAQWEREKAEQADRIKSAFLASMSHELRTPLNSVINFTKFVMRGVMGSVNEQQEKTLSQVIESAKHLLSLINDVLDLSKIEAGSLTLFKEENVDVREILRSSAETARVLLDEKPVKLQTDIPDDIPLITVDRQRILQIMLNLVSNACKFTAKGTITIGVRADSQTIKMYVSDTGIGITKQDQSLIFQPFKQAEAGLRQATGTGLGLPISKSLAEAHGGELLVESTLGVGTTFTVVLPRIPVEEPSIPLIESSAI